jgi:hypothetical protein
MIDRQAKPAVSQPAQLLDAIPSIIVAEDEMGQFLPAAPAGISVFGLRAVEADAVWLVDAAGAEVCQMTAPMLCLGFVASSLGSFAELKAAHHLFGLWSAFDLPEPVILPTLESADRFIPELVASVFGRLKTYADHVTRLSRELFRLRVAHEDTMNAFAKLERFVSEANVQPCRLSFEHEPADGVFVCGARVLRQVLPVSSFGLSAVEIFVGRGALNGILVELCSREDHEVHEVWRLGADDLDVGWIVLPLKGGLGGRQRTPEIVLRPLSGTGLLPDVGLGAPQVLEAFRVSADIENGVEVLPRSLALRTWSGLPGVRPPALTERTAQARGAQAATTTELAMPLSVLRRAVMRSTHWHPEFQPVGWLDDLRALEVHPPPRGSICAEIEGFDPGASAARLSVRGVLRSSESMPVEFAMGFAPGINNGFGAMLADLWSLEAHEDLYFSGWRVAIHDRPALVQVDLPSGLEAGSLFLATRMEDGQVNAFAWACFQDLRATLLPTELPTRGSVIEAPPSPSEAGIGDPRFVVGGIPAPVSLLVTAENVLDLRIGDAPLVSYDHDRRGLLCHPPLTGLTLGRLASLPWERLEGVIARVVVGNFKSAKIEVGMVLTEMSADAVHQRLCRRRPGSSTSFVFSGWQSAAYGSDLLLEVHSHQPLLTHRLNLYFASRLAPTAETNDFAWVYFTDISFVQGGFLVR